MVGRASPRSLPIRLLTSPHDAIISNRWRSPQANFNTRCDGTPELVTPILSNTLTAQIAGPCGGALTRTSSRNGAVNDPASPTHDRGHASSEPRLAHSTRLHPADLAVRAAFWQVTRALGPG